MADNLFAGNGETSALLKSHDWSQTPLGAIETWSESLKTAVQSRLAELNQDQRSEQMQQVSVPPQNCTPIATFRQADQADAFRVTLSDALRLLTDANEIQATAARILGESLGASRVIYVEVLPSGHEVIVHENYTNHVAELSGRYRLEDFGRNLTEDHRAGQTAIVPDVANSLKYTDSEKAMYRDIDIAAHIDVPLIKNNQFVALLAVHQSTPRQWTELEVKQVEETAERTWAAVERARAEAALRESEAKYRMLFESIDEGYFIADVIFDADDRPLNVFYLEANPAVKRVTGLDLAGRSLREIDPNYESAWWEAYGRVAQTGIAERQELYTQPLDSWFNFYTFKIGDADSRRVGCVFQDITQRKRTEQALRDSEQRYRTLFDSIDEGFCVCELMVDETGKPYDHRVLEVNPAFEILTGLQQVTGKVVSELIPTLEPFWLETYARVVRTGESTRFESYLQALNCWFDVYVTPINAPQGQQFAVLFRDITDRTWATLNAEFLATVRDDLAEITEVGDIVQMVGDRLHRYLNISSCAFVEINERADEAVIYHHWHQTDIPTKLGMYALPQFVAEEFLHTAQAGQPIVVRNVAADPRIVDSGKYAALSIGAELNIPLIRDGEWKFSLTVFHPVPYDWRDDEIALMQELASRIWTKLERARTEAALRESEQRFRLMADAVPQIVWITDTEGRVEFFNKQWSNYTGVPYEPTTAAEVAANFVHPDDGDRTITAFNEARRTGGIFSVEHRIRSAAGTYRWFLVRAEPYRDLQTGEIIRWFGVSIDIHERKRAEAELRGSEARYRLLAEAIPQFIWITDAAGHNEYVNQRFCDYTGLTAEQMHGLNWLSIIHPDDLEMTHDRWLAAVNSGQFYEIEYRFRRHDGSYRWFLGQGIPLKDEQGRIRQWFGTCTDIEPQKQIEQARLQLLEQEQAAREQAENANRIKDEFLAVLSHELRSPLNPILGWTRLLRNGNLAPARQMDALATIERNAKLQSQLIEDLLDISRIMQGKLTLTATPVSLAFVIVSAVETVRLAADAKNIQIMLDLDPDAAPVSGDAARLQQVVWNLLTNAVKFTDSGGQVTVQLRRVAAEGDLGNAMAQIRVIDTGKGISPKFLPHVFEYFRQEDGSTTRRFGGLGLGLAIARQIVELHGGTVKAESRGEHQGATFSVQLPTRQASLIELEPTEAQARSEARLQNVKILLVDDDTDTREFEAFLLKQQGATVIAAASGSEALQALDQSLPDVIISDIGMAEIDGYMLMQQIRSRPPAQGGTIPAIALTAYAAEIDQRKALQSGYQKHLTKPLEPQQLVSAIVTLLRG
ncbi:PAS domain S-box protein [Leptolyngbya sp. FACHB-17]|nr:PAS domain S-box protein [Leptolyngbya sp. FACHB-17]